MEIKEKVIKPTKPKKVYEVDGEEFDTKSAAQARLKQIEESNKEWEENGLIEQKIFDKEWVCYLGNNRLARWEDAKKQGFGVERGFKDGYEISYGNISDRSDIWEVKDWSDYKNFLNLYAGLIKKGINVEFHYREDRALVSCILDDGKIVREGNATAEYKDFYSLEGLMPRALKDVVVKYCKDL